MKTVWFLTGGAPGVELVLMSSTDTGDGSGTHTTWLARVLDHDLSNDLPRLRRLRLPLKAPAHTYVFLNEIFYGAFVVLRSIG
jgi:hypothetical protein